MHLTQRQPEALGVLKTLGLGLHPIRLGDKRILVIKAPKEMILTAKENQGFSFYSAPVEIGGVESFLLITAFFDDGDQPLAFRTPILKDDSAIAEYIALFENNEFEVYFFDEHDREWLSFKAGCDLTSLVKKLRESAFHPLAHWKEMQSQAEFWFGTRRKEDDENSYQVKMIESIFTDNLTVINADPTRFDFQGAGEVSATMLERKEPGSYQEWDIALLMRRAFPGSDVYLSPYKVSDGKELCDVLVMGEFTVYLIQAKDSPNTAKILKNSIERKRLRSISQVEEAANQLEGAISYCKLHPLLELTIKGARVDLDISQKNLMGIVVIKEIFDDDMQEYTKIMFNLMNKTEKNAVVFDYPELSQMTRYCNDEGLFLGAIAQILDKADEEGMLYRLRYSGEPPNN